MVIVEKVQTQKDVLKNEASSASLICSTLKELHQSIPSKGVLLQTKIGHVVNKLRYHADPSVKEQARLLLKKWKGFYRELNARQELEVRSDLATERYRSKAKALIAKATGLKVVGGDFIWFLFFSNFRNIIFQGIITTKDSRFYPF